jgi:putative ABC transport system permease protein
MKLPALVLLPWMNLTHRKGRFLASVAGVAFAVLLMFMQLGFWNGLLDSAAELIGRFNGELVVVSRAKYSLTVMEPFSRQRLVQARGVAGVRDVHAVYLERGRSLWQDPEQADADEPARRPIRVVAFDTDKPVLRLPGVAESAGRLREADAVLLDVRSRRFYGRREAGIRRELAGRSFRVVGTFSLGTDFTSHGTVLMNEQTYARLFPRSSSADAALAAVEVGVVQLEPGADPAAVMGRLRRALPGDVTVCTREEFAEQERVFWRASTPIGFFFLAGLVLGFGVGVVICYQVLAAEVIRHLPEFAALKAIGYRNAALTAIVLEEALLLSVLAFVPALAASAALYRTLAHPAVTGLSLRLTVHTAAGVLGLTVVMCFLSGLLAIRKVKRADPAEVFGS